MITRLPQAGLLPRLLVGALLTSCLLLADCERSNPAPPPDVLKAQREAMEKAKATEKVLQDAAERRDAQMESEQK